MKNELEKALRQMQNNPTTGTAHNRNVVSVQVETIFAIDNPSGKNSKERYGWISNNISKAVEEAIRIRKAK